nr:SDR family oxidoreductase [Lachnospiraceae bacterium]
MEKTVLITGCSSGFGRALCNEFKDRGYFVIATARNVMKLADVKADLKIELDASDERSIRNSMKLILSEVAGIDILINNAGYSVRSAVEEIEIDKLKDMMDVNVFGTIRMIQAVLPVMRKHGGGRIYNIGSISGRMTGIANGGYCSSKYAVEAITEAVRYETKDMGIEICVIEPGAMYTDFFGTLAKNSDEKMKDPDSCYRKIYERDLNFRSRQAKSDVQICAKRLLQI